MKSLTFVAVTILLSLVYQSCVVSGPKYACVENVLKLKPGMNREEVSDQLGISPYDIDCYDSTGNHSLVYKYRVTDRKTVPFLLKETNGRESKGKYMDLVAYYDSCDVVYKLESRVTDSKLKEKRVNFNSVISVITVTIPSVFVYLGITNQ